MKYIIIALFLTLSLCSCRVDEQYNASKLKDIYDNKELVPILLFEKDGCKVYSFRLNQTRYTYVLSSTGNVSITGN